MKTEALLNIIGEINDEWLSEAEVAIMKNKNFEKLVKLGILAAAASFALVAAVWMMYKRQDK